MRADGHYSVVGASSIKRKDSELQAKSGALEEKDTTISAMSEQLTNVREYLATEKQVSTKYKDLLSFNKATWFLLPMHLHCSL